MRDALAAVYGSPAGIHVEDGTGGEIEFQNRKPEPRNRP